MIINIDANTNVQKVSDFVALSSKWDVLIELLPSRFKDVYRRGDERSVRLTGRWITPRKSHFPDTRGLLHITHNIVTASTKLVQIQSRPNPSLEKKSGHKDSLLTRKLFYKWSPLRKSKFLQWSVMEFTNKIPVQSFISRNSCQTPNEFTLFTPLLGFCYWFFFLIGGFSFVLNFSFWICERSSKQEGM